MPAAERSSASPGAFLGLDSPYSDLARARVVVVPLPYEATVSYAGGTAAGPEAILAASRQVELYDRDFAGEPALAYGVHTLPPLSFPPGLPPATVQERVTQAVAAVAKEHFPLALGGEHSLSPGVFAGLCQARPGVMFDIVHLDAHADLRDSYDATPYSHACAARRLLENPACRFLWQLGIRSLASEEASYIRERPDRIRTWFIEELRSGTTWREELHRGIQGRPVFLTFDVDCLDPAVVPATGTPEPDGLAWREALDLVAGVVTAGRLEGMDVVELAPVSGLHYAEFNVAKLLYAILNRVFAGKGR